MGGSHRLWLCRRLIRVAGVLGLAVLLLGGLALRSMTASAAGASADGLVEIDATVVGGGGTTCNVTLRIGPVPGAPKPVRATLSAALAQHCNGLTSPQTGSVTLAAAAGRAALSITPTNGGTLNEDPVYGGDCGPDGGVTIMAGEVSRCSLTLYALGGSFTLSTGPEKVTHTVQVTEQVVANTGTAAAGDPSALLCDTSFRLELLAATGADRETAATRACAQQGTQAPGSGRTTTATTTTSLSALTNVAVTASALGTGPPRFGVRDDFTAPGYLTTYSNGCTALTDGGAAFTMPADPLSCTITHTYLGGNLTAHDALLTVTSKVVGTGTLCGTDLSLTVTPPGGRAGAASATSLDPQCVTAGPRAVESSGTLRVAVVAGDASLALRAAPGSTFDYGTVWSGDCRRQGRRHRPCRRVQALHRARPYPLLASARSLSRAQRRDDAPRPGDRTARAGRSDDPRPGALQLCDVRLRLGVESAGGLSPQSSNLAICGTAGPLGVQRSGDTFSVDDSIDLSSIPAGAAPLRFGLRDDFNASGYLTTYSDGCTHLTTGAGQLDTPANPLSCTITHTYVGGHPSADDGLLEIDSAVSGPGGSVCDATVHLANIATNGQQVGATVVVPKPSACDGLTGGALLSGSAQLAVAAGTTRLTATTGPRLAGLRHRLRRRLRQRRRGEDARRHGLALLGHALPARRGVHVDRGGATRDTARPGDRAARPESVGEPDQRGERVLQHDVPGRPGRPRRRAQPRTAPVHACSQVLADKPSLDATVPTALTTLSVTYATTPGVVERLGVTDDFTASGYLTTFSSGCKELTPAIAEYDGGTDPITCTITHTYTGPSTPAPTPASATSVSCPVAGSVAAVDGTMTCAVTVTAPAGAPAPTGTVTVSPGSETCNIATDPCQVTVPTGTLAGTQEAVSASFPGQSGLTGSTGDTAVTLTLRATATAMACQSMSADGNGITYDDQQINCTLTVTDQLAPSSLAPDGQVSATGGTDTETCTIDTSTHSCMVTLSSGGLWTAPLTITSNYLGDGSEFAPSSGSEAMTVLFG